ncbi:hypothetical protein K8089_06775, partial [Aequorivita sp. F47161]
TTIDISNLETLTTLALNVDGKTLEYTDEDGVLTSIDLETVIKNFETLTKIIDNGDGTYNYIDEDGVTTVIDANTTRVTVVDGVYTFTDGAGTTITTIDTNADAIAFDNSTNGFTATNVQAAIEEINTTINTTRGDLTVTGGIEFTGATDGLNKLLADAGIQVADGGITTAKLADNAITSAKIGDGEVKTADIADAAVTTTKIVAGTAGQVMITNAAGDVEWVNQATLQAQLVDGTTTVVSGTGTVADPYIVEVKDGAITTAKLADNAVTSAKIGDGEVKTADIADLNVTADKLGADAADVNKIATVNADGSVSYKAITTTSITDAKDLTAGDTSITVTNGTGATLVNSNVKVTDGGITTAKLADNAVNSDKIIDGEVKTADIADTNVTAAKLNDDVAGVGLVKNATTNALDVQANNGLNVDATADAVQLGGNLIKPTTVTTDATNTLAVAGLQTGSTLDKLVVAEADGTLRQVNAAMPKFFYMPPIIFDTSVNGTFTRNLHSEYLGQFSGTSNPTLVRSTSAPSAIPNVPGPTDLYYYITYYDTDVFTNVSINANGVLTYDIINNATEASFMTIVFVVK